MKKILCLLFCFLFIFSSFPVFAADSTSADVDYDHTSVETDLKSIYGDNLLSRFPVKNENDEMQIITVYEHGVTRDLDFNADDYGLYIYLYNPSGKKINDSVLNVISIADEWDDEGNPVSFSNYPLMLLSCSDNNVLLKYKVAKNGNFVYLRSDGSRSYTVCSVDIYSGGTNSKDVNIAYTYTFSGFGATLSCVKDQITVINVDVYQTSYLTGNSEKYGNGYSNQINSVYFTIGKDWLEKYGDLYSVKYEYYKYRTRPMILVEYKDAFDKLYANRGKIVDNSFDYNLNRVSLNPTAMITYLGPFCTEFLYGIDEIKYNHGLWQYEESILDNGVEMNVNESKYYPNFLTTFFLAPGCTSGTVGNVLLTADQIQDYFLNYNASYLTGMVQGKYSADLFNLNYFAADDIYHVDKKTIKDSFNVDSYLDTNGWWSAFLEYGFGYEEIAGGTIKNEPCFKKLTLDDFRGVTPSEMSSNLLISSADFDHISNLFTSSSKNNEELFLLRYAVTDDYYSMPLDYYQKGYVTDMKFNDALFVEQTVYLDFDIIQFSFKDNLGKETVIAVSSSPSDGFTDIENTYHQNKFPLLFGNGDGKVTFNWIPLLLMIVLVVSVVIVVKRIASKKQDVNLKIDLKDDKK